MTSVVCMMHARCCDSVACLSTRARTIHWHAGTRTTFVRTLVRQSSELRTARIRMDTRGVTGSTSVGIGSGSCGFAMAPSLEGTSSEASGFSRSADPHCPRMHAPSARFNSCCPHACACALDASLTLACLLRRPAGCARCCSTCFRRFSTITPPGPALSPFSSS